MKKIILASNNAGKCAEIKSYLAPFNVDLITQAELGINEIPETGLSFVENALIKARHATQEGQCAALADDSGLVVDALAGAPGIYSARYAGENATDSDNIQKLLTSLQDVPVEKRTARFICVLIYMKSASDPTPLICQGSWQGHILLQPQGDGGFGYDPVFYVPTHDCSAAQLNHTEKNRISHRGLALAQLQQSFV